MIRRSQVMQTITTVGLDIAKSVFQVHCVDADGEVVLRRQLKRRYVLAFFQKLPPCLVGIEACASSHYWSRELQALGHTVRLMPPAYVKPYVKRHKNDAADAKRLRSRHPAKHALRADQDPRTAKLLDASSHTTSVHSPTDGHHQFHSCTPRRVRGRRTGRAPWCRAIAQGRRRCQRRDSPGLRGCSRGSIAGAEGPDPGLRSPHHGL